ncbi:MAG: radical SAM family heme chaperone HemW [Bacteroidales bacterium]|nr:radical SAM family heme chaperone HemW [Bacteroidales bacterium]
MIYLHIPFCKSFCTYCDFYSELCSGKGLQQVQNFVEGIFREIDERREEIDAVRAQSVKTLYVGGGTPSVIPLEALQSIVVKLGYKDYDEFTVEVNPDDITSGGEEYVRELKSLGVNRVSMGVQSFDDGILKWMNRRHTSAGAFNAFKLLRKAGFGNISIDLIFGLSQLGEEKWIETIRKALDLCPEHISAYQLSIEEGSALAGMVRDGRYTEAPEEQCRSQYDILCRELGKAGYNHYEISNFARPGFEAVHNSAYWKRLPYVGLGPGAHSLRLVPEQVRSWNSQTLDSWTRSGEILIDKEIREERIMLGLRTKEGVDGMSIPEDKWFVSDDIISNLI